MKDINEYMEYFQNEINKFSKLNENLLKQNTEFLEDIKQLSEENISLIKHKLL